MSDETPPAVEPLGTTTGGLPYPETSDPLNQGANAIKALALALESRGHGMRIEVGKRTVATVGPDGQASFVWTTRFGGAPYPMLMAGWPLTVPSLVSSVPPDAAGCTFTVRFATDNSAFVGNAEIWYIAVGPN